MNKKILALLIVLVAAVSIAGACAGEELVSHDFGKFKMNIPESTDPINETQGSVNQTIYVVPNTDFSKFADVIYYDSSNANGTNNTTDFVLNVGYKDLKKETNGNVTKMVDGRDTIYCVSSSDNSKVVVVVGSDTRLPDAVKSIGFN